MSILCEEKEFNLLHDPWILVKNKDNETKKWSILNVFRHAHEVQQLAGEIPTQDIAVMRLLLAIMHATFVNSNVEGPKDAIQLWQELWELKSFPYEMIEKYLMDYEDRFWLFHPQYPFYQSAHIVNMINEYKAAKGKKAKDEEKLKTVARLIGELFQSDHVPRLFPGRSGVEQCVISYDEAARWLLHLNGFDDDSAKNPTPKGVGYLGQLGLIYARGSNLFETLMLNFVLIDANGNIFEDGRETAKAVWEKPPCTIVENLIPQPNAQKDLLTMQSRRILLKRNHGQVIGYLLTMGDYFDVSRGLFNEQMTLWKKGDKVEFIPKRHKPEKQVWRDFPSLINTADIGSNGRNSGLVSWLQKLKKQNLIPASTIGMNIVGIYYQPKGAGWQIVDFVDDSLRINAAILDTLGDSWVKAIINVLNDTDAAVSTLGWLASNIATAEGDSSDDIKTGKKKIREHARETEYHHLDKVFRTWLLSIDPQKDCLENKMEEWRTVARDILLTDGEKMIAQCSEKALAGYLKKEKDSSKKINVFIFYGQFKAGIYKALG